MKTTKVKSCSSCIDNLAKKKECINKIKQIQLMTERYTLFDSSNCLISWTLPHQDSNQ